MRLRLNRIVCLVCLMFLIPIASFADLPTDQDIDKVYRENPYLIYEMVRLGYAITHNPPEIILPDRKILMLKNGDLRIEYEGEGDITIGEPPYCLEYTFKLQPHVEVGFRRPQKKISPLWYILGGVGVFSAGLTVGILIARR